MTRTRRANLESTVSETPNKDGYYEAKVWMGFRADGKPDRRHVQRRTLTAVRRRVRELERARDSGKAARAGRVPTVREMLERHLDTVLPSQEISPKTIESYRSLCRTRIWPRWGGQRADRLMPEDIQDALAAWRRARLSVATRRKIFAVLSSAYAVQVRTGALTANPCVRVTAPKVPESEMPHLVLAEMRAVLAAVRGRPNATRWAVALATGLRQGEALGLRWEYLDLDAGTARIWWQLQRLTWAHGCATGKLPDTGSDRERRERQARDEHECALQFCKTVPCPEKCSRHSRACPPPCPPDCTGHASRCPERALPEGVIRVSGALVLRPIKEKRHKTVRLGPGLTAWLREHRDEQYLQKLAAGPEWEDHDLVWCQWNGRPVDPRRDWAEWGTVLESAGSRHRVHVIRHSAVTMLRDSGVEAEVVQGIVGHSEIRVTRRYYHERAGAAADAAGRGEQALGIALPESS